MKRLFGVILIVLLSVTVSFSQDKTVMLLDKPTAQLKCGETGFYVKKGDTTFVLGETQDNALWNLRDIYCQIVDRELEKYDILSRADVVKMMNYFEIERIKKIIAAIKEEE